MIQSESLEQVLSTLSCASSTNVNALVSMECEPDSSLVELITSEYGEICSPDCDSISQENLPLYPLDLSLKSKCPSSRIFPLMSIS